jgi:hypothetical protein
VNDAKWGAATTGTNDQGVGVHTTGNRVTAIRRHARHFFRRPFWGREGKSAFQSADRFHAPVFQLADAARCYHEGGAASLRL